jgi:hypothetical protein
VAREEAGGAPPQDVQVHHVCVKHDAAPEQAGGPWPHNDLRRPRERLQGVRAYDPITKRVHETCDVVFDEQAQWDWGSGGDDGKPGGGDDVFTVEYTTMGSVALMADEVDEAPTEESPLPVGAGDMEVDDDVDDENLDADHHDDAPLRFRSMSGILATPGFAPRALVAEELHVVSSDEPASFTEAEHDPSWRKAMMEEMESIEENGTWSLVDLPPGRKPIGVK